MLGCLYLDEGKPEAALAQFDAGIELHKGTAINISTTYANKGAALEMLGRWAEADRYYSMLS